jgi:hypothetical protein
MTRGKSINLPYTVIFKLTVYSINCRLPQTPRSPFATASHYFDDIFSRSGRPQTPGHRSVRRSSITRSIGNRSDFNSTVAGDMTPPASSTLDDDFSTSPQSRRGSTAPGLDGDDEHLNHYVESQLQRVRSSASMAAYEDEFITKAEKENGA